MSERTKYLRDLHRTIVNHFSDDELKLLAFDMSVEWSDLSGETRLIKAHELVMHLERRGQLEDLVLVLQEERPNVKWVKPPAAKQQVEVEQAMGPNTLSSYFGAMEAIEDKSSLTGRARAILYTEEVLDKLDFEKLSHLQIGTFVQYVGRAFLPKSQPFRLNLKKTTLKQIDLSRTDLRGALLQNANLGEADLQEANLERVNLSDANLYRANLDGANLREATLNDAILLHASYSTGTIWPTGFNFKQSGALGPKSDLRDSDLSGVILEGYDLSESILRGIKLCEAHLVEVNLHGANLEEANLSGAKLQQVNLSLATLNEAILQETNLERANLYGVSMKGADLSRANLYKANLEGADLSEANLSGADVRAAHLSRIILNGAQYDAKTKWPPNLDFKQAGAIFVDE